MFPTLRFFVSLLLIAISQEAVWAQVWTNLSAYREPTNLAQASTKVQTANGYYETGTYFNTVAGLPPSRGEQDVYLRRIGPDGRVEWTKTYGGADFDNQQLALALPDGGLLLGMNYYSAKLDIGNGDTLSGNLPTLPGWMNPYSVALLWIRPDGTIRKAITSTGGPISIIPDGPKMLTYPGNHLYIKVHADTAYHPSLGGVQLSDFPYPGLQFGNGGLGDWYFLIDGDGNTLKAVPRAEHMWRQKEERVNAGTHTNTISLTDTTFAKLTNVKRVEEYFTGEVYDSVTQEQYAWVETGLDGGFRKLIPTGLRGYRSSANFNTRQTPLFRMHDGTISMAFEASAFGLVNAAGDTLRDTTTVSHPTGPKPFHYKIHTMAFNPNGSAKFARILSIEGDSGRLNYYDLVYDAISQPAPGQYQLWLSLRGSTKVDGMAVADVPSGWEAGLPV